MSGLRIGCAAPWNVRSAVAQSASEVAFELKRRGHELTILRTEVGECLSLPIREAPGPVHNLADYSDHALHHKFDVITAHFGDHYGFHGALLPRLEALEVVGIFHDACIPHLIRGWTDDDNVWLRHMVQCTYAGLSAADVAFAWNDLAHVARNHPMIEWVAHRTVGAVAHARHYADRLRNACPGPISIIPLAFDVRDLPPPPPSWKKLTVAVVGHANSNKRIDQLILAVGASYLLRARCRIRIIGHATDAEIARLTDLADRIGLKPPVFTGWVSDEDLRWELRDVDVISCLRNPILEGASASLILALTSGRPTLVTGHGCYAEVPENAVLVCSPDGEALDVLRHLEHLIHDPAFGAAVGGRAREFVRTRHSAASYVDELEPFLTQVISELPATLARRHLSDTLDGWGLTRHDPTVARFMTTLAGIAPSGRST